ncbi:ABC transporter permease [Paenibacillus lautus]|uniref:ABC transporter permease n=1 Tax=Paenibacillus lautus TaxID=1401 RepID=UPI000BBDD2A1|nr:ABC-2 family transporter protein [Paenibacillus lautus]PCL90077.1 hypothetical protein CPZ30_26385 [Paenibacillus lautus]
MFKIYSAIAYKAFLRNTAYRSEVYLRIFGNFIVLLIQISIWRALLREGSLNGIDFQTMITYSLINVSIAMLLMNRVVGVVDERLKTGDITMDLVKPLSYPILLFFDQLGNIIFRIICTVIPTVIIASVIFGFSLPADLYTFTAFIVSLILALIISFLIGYLIALISFWFLTTFALDWMISALITVFSGSFLPLWFFTDGWRSLAEVLPFQFLGFVPAAIYMNKMSSNEIIFLLLKGGVWVLILMLLSRFLWWRAVRRLVIQGG